MDALRAAGSDVLGDLALVVREHQVHAAAVDVELAAEVFLAHHGALEVPAREAFAPRGRPAHDVLGFCLFPDGEVEGGLLVALAVERARALEGRFEVAAGEDAVAMELIVFRDVEIDGTV